MHPVRAELIAQLEAHLPVGKVKLHPYPTPAPALEPRRPWPLIIGLDGVTATTAAVHGREYRCGLVLVCPSSGARPADIDELDARLELVLRAIDDTDRVVWETVEAVAYGDQAAPAYTITATLHATRQE